eukprot:673473-Rhodomonas_salina.5
MARTVLASGFLELVFLHYWQAVGCTDEHRAGTARWVYQDGGPAGDPPGLKRMLDGSASWY